MRKTFVLAGVMFLLFIFAGCTRLFAGTERECLEKGGGSSWLSGCLSSVAYNEAKKNGADAGVGVCKRIATNWKAYAFDQFNSRVFARECIANLAYRLKNPGICERLRDGLRDENGLDFTYYDSDETRNLGIRLCRMDAERS